MKTFISILSLTCLITLNGCEKEIIDRIKGHGKKKYQVDFRFGGLNHTVGEPNNGFQTEPLKNYISQLSVVVYNKETGNEVARQTKFSTQSTFADIKFELPVGNYQFVAAGSKTPFAINQFRLQDTLTPVFLPYSEANMQYWQNTFTESQRLYKTSDTFLAQVEANITSNKTLEMIMQRIVGKLEVRISDLTNYQVEVYIESTAVMFASGRTFGRVQNNTFPRISNLDGPVDILLLNTSSPVDVELLGAGTPRRVSVPIYKNKITVLEGNMITEKFTITVK
jgi:hypothetical protein